MAPLAATCAGEGPTVVVLHGFTQTAASMAPLVDRLASTRRVVALDLPGPRRLRGRLGGPRRGSGARRRRGGRRATSTSSATRSAGAIALHVACAARDGAATHRGRSRRRPASRTPSARRATARAPTRRSPTGSRRTATSTAFLGAVAAQPALRHAARARSRTSRVAAANTAAGLADSLRRCSVGTQRWLGDELATLERPAPDAERRARRRRSSPPRARSPRASTPSAAAVVPGAGHVAHLEQPDVTARLLDALPRAP